MIKRFSIMIVGSVVLSLACVSPSSPTKTWLPAKMAVSTTQREWVVSGKHHKVSVNRNDLAIRVDADGIAWEMAPSGENDLLVEMGGETFPVRLSDAGRITCQPYQTGFKSGIKLVLERFAHKAETIDLRLQLFVCLEGAEEDLVFEVIAEENGARVKHCDWPREFVPAGVDFTVVPFMQGMLLPKDWPRKVRLYDTRAYSRGLYMPWWGYLQGASGVVAILETPADGACRFEHPASGPTRMGVRWLNSLGRLGYPRRVRFCFFKKGNYVDLAKRYRRYVMETGHFVSLKEKIARSPIVAKLIGSPVVHTSILQHIQPTSSYYNRTDPTKNHQLVTFDERAEQLRKLADKGFKRVYVHLDGWGFRGYDNLHPDLLPPCPEAGGWEGMKRFADTCEALGFVFAVHDQYRDYYHDAASYDPRHTILQENGQRPFGNTWFGGDQSILCPRLAPGHVAKNHRAILRHGVKLRGAYLDVFAVVPPDECYSPEHPVPRADCLKYRGDCMDLIRALEGVVSSEEPADWAIPHIDLVHHGPFALDPNPGKGPAMGIPVPLFNLVYHDAILLPWSLGKGAWGIPQDDLGFLHGLANAGLPYLSLNPNDTEMTRVRTMCQLHERVGMLEMTGHEFLDAKRRQQRTTFADGTTVTINLEAETYEIKPELAKTQP